MPNPLADAAFDQIAALCATLPQPFSLETVCSKLGPSLSRRTVQRRLAALAVQRRLVAVSRGGGRRYHLRPATTLAAASSTAASATAAASGAATAATRVVAGAANAGATSTPGFAPAALPPGDPAEGARIPVIPPPPPAPLPDEPAPPAIAGTALVLSPTAEALRQAVARPRAARPPVGYNAAFADAYRPNESAYLPPAQLARLAALGRLPGGPQPAGTSFGKLLDRLLVDLAWNSSRLDGNTYSFLEAGRLRQLGAEAAGRTPEETLMLRNHQAAIELLAEPAAEPGFDRPTLCNLHALLGHDLLRGDQLGRLRAEAMVLPGSVYQPPAGAPAIEERFQRLLATSAAIVNPFEQAFFALVHLPYLQPFADLNERLSRLAANLPLRRHNLCPLSFVDVPPADYHAALLAVHELNRIEYLREVFLWAYECSCARYAAVRAQPGAPDAFRVRHRGTIGEIVAGVVRQRLGQAAAVPWIAAQAAARVPAEEAARCVAAVEAELCELHEGSIARFRLRPAEYHAWKLGWA